MGKWIVLLKNSTASDVPIPDLGVVIPASGQRQISDTFTFDIVSTSEDLKELITDGTLVVNNGTSDLSIARGLKFIFLENYDHVETNYITSDYFTVYGHPLLGLRDALNSHPITAITGLDTELTELSGAISDVISDTEFLSAAIDSSSDSSSDTAFLSGAIDNLISDTAFLSGAIDDNSLDTIFLSGAIDDNSLDTVFLSGAIDNNTSDTTFLSGAIDNLISDTEFLSAAIDAGGGGAGLVNLEEDTVVAGGGLANASILRPNWGTNTDLVLSPIGTGAFIIDEPDGASTGGNARGSSAVDLQKARTAATQVASGDYSFVGGGRDNTASGDYAVTTGYRATAGVYGQKTHASGYIAAAGDAQTGTYVLRALATSASEIPLTTNGNGVSSLDNQIHLSDNQAISFIGTIVAKRSADTTNVAAWKVEGLVVRGTGVGSVVLIAHTKTVINTVLSWSISVVADTTNGCLRITFTGDGGANVAVVASIQTSEATY